MSHVTQEQALELRRLGFPQKALPGTGDVYLEQVEKDTYRYRRAFDCDQPSAEELMEWLLKGEAYVHTSFLPKGLLGGDEYYSLKVEIESQLKNEFEAPTLVDALFLAACWVLEGKK